MSTQSTKILFVIDSLGFGGAERQLVELVKGLDKARYEIHVVSLLEKNMGYADIVTSIDIEVRYFPRAYKLELAGPLFALVRYIREHEIDLVHTFMNMGSLFGGLAAKITRRPVICSAIRDAMDSSLKAKCLKRFLAVIADFFVANSRAGFANRFKKTKPHFRVVYNGVDFSRFEDQDDKNTSLKENLEIARFGHVIGMVGSLSHNKDQETLLQAASIILKAFPDAGFLLVGDGEMRPVLKNMVQSLGLQNHVVFAGFRKDVDNIYSLLDVCVLLTNTRMHLEGIPNAVIEAMACDVPVVASDGGGTPEIVRSNETGILVPPGNPVATAEAIIHILSSPSEANLLAQEAKIFVKEIFSLERYVREYELLYNELTNNR